MSISVGLGNSPDAAEFLGDRLDLLGRHAFRRTSPAAPPRALSPSAGSGHSRVHAMSNWALDLMKSILYESGIKMLI